MAKINLKPIKDLTGQLLDVAVYGLMMGVVYKVYDYATDYHDHKPIKYDDAVKEIMNSSMWSKDKSEAIHALKPTATSSYYKAVIHIMKDTSTFSSDKINMIKQISE